MLKSLNTNRWMLVGAAAAALVTVSGCQSKITGNEGNLVFSYTADDDLADFNKPIAVGAKLQVRVVEAGTQRPVTLTDAMTDNDGVLLVDSVQPNAFILEGVGVGNALVEVEADTVGGESVTDSVNMRVAAPEVLKLRHTCVAEATRTALYTAGAQEVLVSYDMETASGESVIGYGLHPVEITPAEGATLYQTSTDQAFLHLDLMATPGEVTISSTLDDTELTLKLIEEAAIDGAEMNPVSNDVQVLVDNSYFLHFWPTVAGDRVCQSKVPMTASSRTPEICEVVAIDDADDSKILNESNFIRITGKAIGNCEYEVVFPGGNGGEGAQATYDVEVLGGPDDTVAGE